MADIYQFLEWDLATPLKNALREYIPKYIELGPLRSSADLKLPLSSLGKLVESKLAKPQPQVALQMPAGSIPLVRKSPRFIWVDVRLMVDPNSEGITAVEIEETLRDPLYRQQLTFAAQSAFISACVSIAQAVKAFDTDMESAKGKMRYHIANPAIALERHPVTDKLVAKICDVLAAAQQDALKQMVAVKIDFRKQSADLPTARQDRLVGVKLFLGLAAFGLGIWALAVTGWGTPLAIAATVIAVAAFYRGTVDLAKALRDQFIAADTIRERLRKAFKSFEDSKRSKNTRGAIEAILNATFKTGAIGFSTFGVGKCASLSDVAEDLQLYNEKLCKMSDEAHRLAIQIGNLMDKIEGDRSPKLKMIPASVAKQVNLAGSVKAPMTQAERERKFYRSKDELTLNGLLVTVSSIAPACDQHLKILPSLQATVNEVLGSKGRSYLKLEKWLDFGFNVLVTIGGTTTGGFSIAGDVTKCSNWFQTIGGLSVDAVSEGLQILPFGEQGHSSRFEG